MKLTDMGTTGLVAFAVTGSNRLRGARTARARKVIADRYKSWRACCAFTNACNAELDRRRKELAKAAF